MKWIAVLSDNSTIEEGNFKDVLEAERENKLDKLFLKDNKFAFGVNLRTGQFYMNGVWFFPLVDFKPGKLRIIFYRRMQFDSSKMAQPEVGYYILGWQTTVDGKNHKRMLFINAKDYKTEMREQR